MTGDVDCRPLAPCGRDDCPWCGWADPIPIEARIGKLPEFPHAALPIVMRRWIVEQSKALEVPVGLAGLTAFGVLATATVGQLRVVIHEGWHVPCNLYVAPCLGGDMPDRPGSLRMVRCWPDASEPAGVGPNRPHVYEGAPGRDSARRESGDVGGRSENGRSDVPRPHGRAARIVSATVTTPPTDDDLRRIAMTTLFDRTNLRIHDARTLYLFGPTVCTVATDEGVSAVRVRTSLEAALDDVRAAVGRDASGVTRNHERAAYWLGACGYLMLLDQISCVFRFDDFERLLRSDLVGLDADDAGAIYGLRNAFIHSYGLVNDADGLSENVRRRRRHTFRLTVGQSQLVTLGDRSDVLTAPLGDLPDTVVDLVRLGDVVEAVVAEIQRRHLAGGPLRWKVDDVTTFVGQSFFTHVDPI
jgi:hypothetical protein